MTIYQETTILFIPPSTSQSLTLEELFELTYGGPRTSGLR